jgi:GNAT superfamily N-acetyltransferase
MKPAGPAPGDPSIRLRETTIDDPALRSLFAELDADLWRAYPEEAGTPYTPNAALVAAGQGVVLLVEVDGEPAACGVVFQTRDPASGEPFAEVKRMYARPRLRGRGLGRLVLERLLDAAHDWAVDEIRLETGERSPAAVALYRALGFEPCACWGAYSTNPLSRCYRLVKRPIRQ